MNTELDNRMTINGGSNGPDWNATDDDPTQEEINTKRDQEMREKLAAEYADGLRQLADFIEEHPNAPRPCDTLYSFVYDREKFVLGVRELAHGGKVTKAMDSREDGYYKATRQFGPVNFELSIPRKTVCRLVSPAVYDCPDSLLEAAAEYSEA
jgi:hypothetical protein